MRLTIKRDLPSAFPELRKKLRHQQKKELLSQVKETLEKQAVPNVPVLMRISNNDQKMKAFTTHVKGTNSFIVF
jgi:2C-methyl-D-erythritol 2,4-cyclodiphosphate synthase